MPDNRPQISPSIIRLGGTASNSFNYQGDTTPCKYFCKAQVSSHSAASSSRCPRQLSCFASALRLQSALTRARTLAQWLSLLQFIRVTGNRLLFCFNPFTRLADGSWNSTEASTVPAATRSRLHVARWRQRTYSASVCVLQAERMFQDAVAAGYSSLLADSMWWAGALAVILR
jgi:hypothetical protein